MKKMHLMLMFLVILMSNKIYAQVIIEPTVTFSTIEFHTSTHVADMDGNGKDDIISGIQYGFGTAAIYIQHQITQGTFSPPVIRLYKIDYNLREIAVGDINNDGLNDIAFTSGDSLSILKRVDTGYVLTTYYSGTYAHQITIADLNNDGLHDIVVGHWSENWISVFLQKTNGFEKNTYPVITFGYNDIAVGDINNDGLNDIVFTNGQSYGPYILYLLQKENKTFDSYKILQSPLGAPNGITIVDINDNGKKDIVLGSVNGLQVGINISPSLSYIVYDTSVSINKYQQADTLPSRSYVNQWVDIKSGKKITYRDSIVITPINIITTTCYDTVIRKKNYSCKFSIDTIRTAKNCIGDVVKNEIQKSYFSTLDATIDCDLIIYPNPAQHFVELHSEKQIGVIHLYMNDGKLIKTYNTSSNVFRMNVSDIPGGVYVIQTSKNQCQKKLLISR